MKLYVVCFQGIPTISFSDVKDLTNYLKAQGTSVEKVTEDMECNGSPNWEWYELACDGPDYKAGYESLMECWDTFSHEQKEILDRELKAAGLD